MDGAMAEMHARKTEQLRELQTRMDIRLAQAQAAGRQKHLLMPSPSIIAGVKAIAAAHTGSCQNPEQAPASTFCPQFKQGPRAPGESCKRLDHNALFKQARPADRQPGSRQQASRLFCQIKVLAEHCVRSSQQLKEALASRDTALIEKQVALRASEHLRAEVEALEAREQCGRSLSHDMMRSLECLQSQSQGVLADLQASRAADGQTHAGHDPAQQMLASNPQTRLSSSGQIYASMDIEQQVLEDAELARPAEVHVTDAGMDANQQAAEVAGSSAAKQENAGKDAEVFRSPAIEQLEEVTCVDQLVPADIQLHASAVAEQSHAPSTQELQQPRVDDALLVSYSFSI